MIFQELSKIKRQMIMSSIVLMALGVLMIICPQRYMISMIGAIGSIMLVFAILGILEYLDSKRSVISYIKLTASMIIGIVGIAILLFEIHSLYAISVLFGVVLILTGVGNFLNAFIYAKRSGRQGWWIMIILSLMLVGCGVIIILHPYWNTMAGLYRAIGVMLLFSALVSILHLIWIWPIKSE